MITVKGKNNVFGTFTHTSAIEALDRNYFEVSNDNVSYPAQAKEFAAKLFEANLQLQYQYGLDTFEGLYLLENDSIKYYDFEDQSFELGHNNKDNNLKIIYKIVKFIFFDYLIIHGYFFRIFSL